MNKPHIKLEARYIHNARVNNYLPCWILQGRYKESDGETWNAGEYLSVEAYNDVQCRFGVYKLVVSSLTERFNKNASDRWNKYNTQFYSQ